jgi:hypothetical protein
VSSETFPLATLSEALRHLRRPVPPGAVHFKVQSEGRGGGLIVGYIDSRTVSERLNLVVGERWSCEFRALEGSLLPVPTRAEDGKPAALPVYAVCRLSVCGVFMAAQPTCVPDPPPWRRSARASSQSRRTTWTRTRTLYKARC